MTMQPHGSDRDPAQDPTQQSTLESTQGVAPLAHPTEGLPVYRKVAGYPAPEPTPEPTYGTGQLPVTGAPVAAPPVIRPRGPHLPTVVRGVVILAMATIVVVWRMVDHPNWPIVGISVGIGVGVMFLLVAAVSAVLHHARDQHDLDRTLAGR